jgi:hypothetical protein
MAFEILLLIDMVLVPHFLGHYLASAIRVSGIRPKDGGRVALPKTPEIAMNRQEIIIEFSRNFKVQSTDCVSGMVRQAHYYSQFPKHQRNMLLIF